MGQRLAAPIEREKKPDDALLFDLLLVWAPDEKVRRLSWSTTPPYSTTIQRAREAVTTARYVEQEGQYSRGRSAARTVRAVGAGG